MRGGAGSLGAIPMLPAPLQFLIAMIAYAMTTCSMLSAIIVSMKVRR